jgi:uncharacterized membrane protein YdjX (TVP38/TMEM64 family)
MPSKVIFIIRTLLLAAWIGVIVSCLGTYIFNPDLFTPENVAGFLRRFQTEIWICYLAMSAARGFTLLPSTPMVIAGTVLFPDQPASVLVVSLVGILISSSLIYFASGFLGFRDYFERKKADLTNRIKARMEHPTGLLFVMLWAFFPLVPTDAVCYVAGTIKMSFPKFIVAVLAGETILCTIYVYLGRSFWSFLG